MLHADIHVVLCRLFQTYFLWSVNDSHSLYSVLILNLCLQLGKDKKFELAVFFIIQGVSGGFAILWDNVHYVCINIMKHSCI